MTTKDIAVGRTKRQLSELSGLLLDLPVENDGMRLGEFDGFVAGILVCPEMIRPSEWLPVVWGAENAPNFSDITQAQATIDGVMAHYNRVARDLAKAEPQYEVVLEEDPKTGKLIWGHWIRGFERAMQLRPDCWEATLDSEDDEVQSSIPMILALHDIEIGVSDLEDGMRGELSDMAPDLIPLMVLALNDTRKNRSGQRVANIDAPPVRPQNVDRNDPCPCGSGKKFKKCCGAVMIH